MDDARCVPAVEGLQALADAGAAAGALRHHRQPVERAGRVALLHGVGDVGEPGVEQEGLGLAEFVEHAVDEAQEDAGVHAHRAGGVEQDDEPQRLFLALPPDQADRHAAMADVPVDGAAKVEPVAAPPRQVAAGEARAHDARQPRRRRMRLLDLRRVGELAEIGLGEIFGARGAFHAAFAGAVVRGLVGRGDLVERLLRARLAGRLPAGSSARGCWRPWRSRWSASASGRAGRARRHRTGRRIAPSPPCGPRTDA